jgi:hypothetical protein
MRPTLANVARRLVAGAAVMTGAFAVTSCSRAEPPAACTLIGCDDGVAVELATVPPAPFSVELTPLPGGPPTIKECTATAACGTTLFFEEVRADSGGVRVTSTEGTYTVSSRVAYSTTRPNGPQCQPACRQARLRVVVP